jgi:Spy/CpxP family protein refolding chaperone
MKRQWYFHLIAIGVLLVSSSVFAQDQDVLSSPKLGKGLEMLSTFLTSQQQFLNDLSLTNDQKLQIINMLVSTKDQILQGVRDNLQGLVNGSLGAETIFANAQMQAAALNMQILEQIKSVLTSDQLEKVQQKQQSILQDLQKIRDRLSAK